jgi:hypothetical protein
MLAKKYGKISHFHYLGLADGVLLVDGKGEAKDRLGVLVGVCRGRSPRRLPGSGSLSVGDTAVAQLPGAAEHVDGGGEYEGGSDDAAEDGGCSLGDCRGRLERSPHLVRGLHLRIAQMATSGSPETKRQAWTSVEGVASTNRESKDDAQNAVPHHHGNPCTSGQLGGSFDSEAFQSEYSWLFCFHMPKEAISKQNSEGWNHQAVAELTWKECFVVWFGGCCRVSAD